MYVRIKMFFFKCFFIFTNQITDGCSSKITLNVYSPCVNYLCYLTQKLGSLRRLQFFLIYRIKVRTVCISCRNLIPEQTHLFFKK